MGEYKGMKRVLGQAVEVNTSTDYLHFREGNEIYQTNQGGGSSWNEFGSLVLTGPVHVNGDVLVGQQGVPYFMIKSNQLYGPVLDVSGYIYNRRWEIWITSYNQWTYVGFGEWDVTSKNPYRFKKSDFTSVFYALDAGINTIYWPGSYTYTKNSPWLYDPKQFPTEVEHFTQAGKRYTYPIIRCKDNGGRKIKIPPTTGINYNYYKPYIDEKFYITWTHPVGKVINITNEGLNAKAMVRGSYPSVNIGNISPGATGFDISFTGYGYEPNYVQFVMFENSETDAWTPSDKWWGGGYLLVDMRRRNYPSPGSGSMSGTSYTIDRVNQKFVFNYPVEWVGHSFKTGLKIDAIS